MKDGWVFPWTQEDYQTHRLPKTCTECGKAIQPHEDFWRRGRRFWHTDCITYGCGLSRFEVQDADD